MGRPKTPWSKARIALRAYAHGANMYEAAEAAGISYSTVWWLVQEHGGMQLRERRHRVGFPPLTGGLWAIVWIIVTLNDYQKRRDRSPPAPQPPPRPGSLQTRIKQSEAEMRDLAWQGVAKDPKR